MTRKKQLEPTVGGYLSPKEQICCAKKDVLLKDLPTSGNELRGYIPGHNKNGRHYVTLDELTTPSYEKANVTRCNEIVEDIEAHLIKRKIPVDELPDRELEQRLKIIMAPGPRRLLEGLRDLNYTEWSLVMEKLRGPIRVAITAYMANLEGYIRDRQTDRAYYERAEKAKQKLYPKKRA